MRKLLAVLTLVAAACSGEADFSGMIDTVTLSAEEHQFEILAVDRLLFTEKPLGEAGIKDLSERLEKLAVRVKGTSDSKFLALEALELRRLAKMVERLPPARSGEPLRNEWMRIRNNLFDDRGWFVRSPADLEYAAQHEKTLQPEPAPLVIEIPLATPRLPLIPTISPDLLSRERGALPSRAKRSGNDEFNLEFQSAATIHRRTERKKN